MFISLTLCVILITEICLCPKIYLCAKRASKIIVPPKIFSFLSPLEPFWLTMTSLTESFNQKTQNKTRIGQWRLLCSNMAIKHLSTLLEFLLFAQQDNGNQGCTSSFKECLEHVVNSINLCFSKFCLGKDENDYVF